MKRTQLAGLQARAKAAAERHANARVVVTRIAAPATDDPDAPPTPQSAELWLYGTVGGYWWGFDSDDVADAMRALGDVDEILVRLHSFGGNAIEGIAIANLLANHPANIRIVVDGLAASAASMIALAGSELIMSPGSQLMVHDAWMCVCGNAAELRAEADWIDRQSQNYAETYAHRAGGTAAEWREVMLANNGDGTWYSAAEAVEAGLATRVENIASTTPPPPMPDVAELDDDADLAAAAAWDFEVLLHPAARAAWSTRRHGAPKPPTASADGSTTNGKEAAVAFSDEQLTALRTKLGVAGDADEATILAALDEALDERAEPAGGSTTTPVIPEGMTLVDTETFNTLRDGATAGIEARRQQQTEHRDRVLNDAITSGRIPASRREHYASLWQADPEGTEQVLNALAPGLVPVEEMGHAQTPAADRTATVDDSALDGFAATLGLSKEDFRG